MKKFYSFVLMAAALLIGTNAWAETKQVGTWAELASAWATAQDGDVIQLTDNIQMEKCLWLGTANMQDDTELSLELDLNGWTLSWNPSVGRPAFFLTHGSLNVTTSKAGGKINHTSYANISKATVKSSQIIFTLTGSTYRTVNPKTATSGYYTHLTIGEGVELNAQGIGVVIDRVGDNNNFLAGKQQWPIKADDPETTEVDEATAIAAGGVTIPADRAPFNTDLYTNRGVAYGVRVDVWGKINAGKYGIKANSELGGPTNTLKSEAALAAYYTSAEQNRTYADDAPVEGDKQYAPFIHIHNDAVIYNNNPQNNGSAALYNGGYANVQVDAASLTGSAGMVIKSGNVQLNNSNISSNYTGAYTTAGDGEASGFEAGGDGIAIISSDRATGATNVTVNGNTKVTGTTGYAIDETVKNTLADDKVEALTINGGTFAATGSGAISAQGTISITTKTADPTDPIQKVTISGGTIENGNNGVQIGNETLQQFLMNHTDDLHGVVVETNELGEQTIVVSTGQAPDEANSVIGAAANSSINWINSVTPTETLVADKKLAELQISQDYAQKLIVSDGVTLEVGRVVLGAKAQIVVEAGGKFIVSGEQGFAAFKESNLLLKNEVVNNEVKRSIFLFHPAVTSNTHPKAIYQLTADSWRVSSSESQAQVFGVPTYQAITSIGCTTDGKYGYIQRYGQNGTWENIAFTDDNPFPYDQLNKPFAAYAITAYRAQDDPKLTFEFGGELYGNSNASLNSTMKWSFFANSYTAEIDLATFLAGLEENAQNVDKYVYVSTVMDNGHWRWDAIGTSLLGMPNIATKLQPMQGFLLNNKGGKIEANAIDYETMVYAPAVPGYTPSAAPRRGIVANDNTANLFIIATREDGAYDNVKIRENAEAESCEKFMNEDVNIYATAEEKSAILAAENLEDTYVGFSTVKGGNFTISFANVAGREFDLIDLETGARVAASEGETYSFSAAANTTNDYRFKLVAPAKMPTAIENTEVKANAKGIFTLTGQFVGEMNVWNTLPAGVYVVNGAKRVK